MKNELRIGNWIDDFGDGEGQVLAIDKDGDILTTANDLYQPWETFNPIPLTEQWLKDFGFEWDIYWQGITDGNWVITEGAEEGSWSIAYGKRRHDKIVYGIRYVHAFQNLMYALTGTELVKEGSQDQQTKTT